MHAHPALGERAEALRARGPEQPLELGAAQQPDLLPSPRCAQAPVAAAQRRRQPVRSRQQRMGLEREGEGGRLHVPAAAHAADLGRERRPPRRMHVLDHAGAVHEIELAARERQSGRGIRAHERARVIGSLGHIHARDVQLRLERPQAHLPAADIEHARARVQAGEREETRMAPRACACRQRTCQPRQWPARRAVDVDALSAR